MDGALPSDHILALWKDREGFIWVGTEKGLVVYSPDGGAHRLPPDDGLYDAYISVIKADVGGGLLVGTPDRIVRLQTHLGRVLTATSLVPGTLLGYFLVLHDGDVLACSLSDRSVIRYHAGAWHRIFSCDAVAPSLQVLSLGEDGQGRLWVGTSLGLFVLEDGHATRIPRYQGLSNQYISAIYRDREDVMWFGTESGVLKLAGAPFRSYGYATGLQGDHVIAIFRDDQKACWFGTYHGAAVLTPDGVTRPLGIQDGLPHPAVHAFARGTNERTWIGSWGGIVACDDRARLTQAPLPMRNTRIICLLNDPDGTIWCGSHGAIHRMDSEGRVLETLDSADGVPPAGISALYLDDQRTLWFGTDSRGCGYYRDGAIQVLDRRHGLPDPWVMSISQDVHGTIWCATQRGAVSWNGQRFDAIVSDEDELTKGIVTFVVRDSLHHLWFGTQRGIYEWNDSVIAHLDVNDGLVADPTRCGYVDGDGDLWVGTVGGVSMLDLGTFGRQGSTPPVRIDGLALGESDVPVQRSSLRYDENTFTACFSSLTFRDERRIEFQWKLAGFDRDWQSPRSERRVRYTHLPPGNYELLVRARRGGAAWSSPAGMAFVIRPPFWGTWWFILCSLALIVGSLVFVYRRRVAGLQAAAQAEQEFSRRLMASQEAERKRIAGELHDSLVQNLLVAKNRSLLGLRNAAEPESVTRELNAISGVLSEAIDEVRDIAHNLRPYQLDRLGLTQALRSLARTMSESTPTVFEVELDEIDMCFSADQSTVLYRIVQEAVTNITKHAQATSAWIIVKRTRTDVRLTIRDNGRGFTDQAKGGPAMPGFGLSGIEQRVRMLDGQLSLGPGGARGTELHIILPYIQGPS